MKILLISGHGAGDPGAVGNGFTEEAKNIEIAQLVQKYLSKYATVDIYDITRNAYQDVRNGNFSIGKYNYVMEFHFNAFNGTATGTECYVVSSESGITVEQAVMKELSAFFKLRDNDGEFDGVKRTNFSVISKVKSLGMSGALYEICFIDNAADMAIYESKKEEIAQAITRGVAKGFGLTTSGEGDEQEVTPEEDVTTEGVKNLISVMAQEVIQGLHGNGHTTREASLREKYGDIDYEAVRAKVNELLGVASTTTTPSVTTMAQEVIKGLHGNGHATREASLKAKYGNIDYQVVRAKVNELLS